MSINWLIATNVLFLILIIFLILAYIKNRKDGKRTALLLRNAYQYAEELNQTLAQIAKSSALFSGDLKKVADTITQKGCHVLKTSRLEVWRETDGKGSMKNISTFEAATSGYIEERPDYNMPGFEEYERMLKTERLFTTNNAKMYEIFLSTRDSLSAKSIASIEAPIWIDGELAGVICFEQEACEAYPQKRIWSMEEHSFTTALADFMTIVIVNAERRRLEEAEAEIRAEKERIGTELNVATQIQADMLPNIFPAFPHRTEFDIYASMQPAKAVGGDFYDFFLINENTLAVVMADVSGKGVPAALFMVITKTLIKNTALSGKRPEVVFGIVNRMLCEHNDAGMFVTAILGYLDIPTGRFTFVNAGHNPPLLRSGEHFGWLKVRAGFVLAGDEDTFYRQHEITLNPGDELFLYTDGVTEAVNHKNELFSDQRLLTTVNNYLDLPLQEFTVSIKREIDTFADGAEQADDITMLALRYKGLEEKVVMNELVIEAKIENMDAVQDFISAQIKECPMKIQNQIALVVDEIFSNIARYAYHPKVGGAAIRINVGDDVTIEFEDSGIAYDPLSSDDPDIALPAEKREIGGLGLFMVKKMMDSVEYRREGNKNILTIKKRLAK